MNRKFTLAFITVMILHTADAQVTFGIRTGLNYANWQGAGINSLNNIVAYTKGFVTTTSRKAFHIGGYADIPLGNGMSFEPGLQYSQKGYVLKGDLAITALKFIGVNASAKVESNYIDIPLLLKADLSKGLSIYAGPQVSFLVHSDFHLNAGILGISLYNKKIDITSDFNKTDLGLSGGIGYQFSNGINMKAGYDYGLTRLDKNDSYKAYNRVVKISLGYRF